jgi:hypothetical protein
MTVTQWGPRLPSSRLFWVALPPTGNCYLKWRQGAAAVSNGGDVFFDKVFGRQIYLQNEKK